MLLNPTHATYNNLLLAFRFMNEHLFDSILPHCLITLQREKKSFGYFCGNKFTLGNDSKTHTDEIALNPQYFRANGRSDIDVVSTLVHEMCHLWQHHFGDPGRSRYHNKEWSDKMVSIGLQPSNTGSSGGKTTGDQMSHFIIDRGPFSHAFRELVTTGFLLEWIEYPVHEESIVMGKIETDDSEYSSSRYPVSLEEPTETTPLPRKADTSKMKFTCPECGLNAWAKMGAHLVCGDCEETLVTTSNQTY